MTTETTALIGLDWGTTRLRAYRVSTTGEILEQRDDGPGIMSVEDGAFEAVFEAVAGDWVGRSPGAPVVASGMIGSRQGWHEVPYLACPAGTRELAGALAPHRTAAGITIHFVPGLSHEDEHGVPDVMRGEETQLAGAFGEHAGAALALLPGTHSKWVWLHEGAVTRFSTFMTGELFGLLASQSILARLMSGDHHDAAAFARGVRHGHRRDPAAGGLLRRLFSARTLALFGRLGEDEVHAYLSGLVIGAEIGEALGMGAAGGASEVTLIGGELLAGRYQEALEVIGIAARSGPANAAANGQLSIARSAGLLG